MALRIPPDVLKVLRRQDAQLRKVAPKHRAALLAASRRVTVELEKRLKSLPDGVFTAQQQRVVLAQARLLVARYEKDVAGELEDLGKVAGKIGRDGLLEQIKAWNAHFKGAIGRIAPTERAAELLDDALLLHYRSSSERYGLEKIARIQGVLAEGVLRGETTIQVADRLSSAIDLSEAWAERIVRTEQSLAVNRRELEDMRDMADPPEAWRKQLIATFDSRTGEDSRFVHGQTRGLDEPFRDNEGRTYMHPPNRPNDREVMIFVPAPPRRPRPSRAASTR